MERLTKHFFPIASFFLVVALFWYLGRWGIGTREIVATFLTAIGYLSWYIGRTYLGRAYALLPEAKHVVSSGLYAKIRHPLYVSQMLVLAGVFLYVGDHRLWWLYVAILLFQIFRARSEEQVLLKQFGEEYATYMNSTWF